MRHASPSYSEALGRHSKGPQPKKLDHLRIHAAENGGHIVEHHFESNGPVFHEPEQHVFGDGEGKEALAHVAKHMGIKAHKEPDADDE